MKKIVHKIHGGGRYWESAKCKARIKPFDHEACSRFYSDVTCEKCLEFSPESIIKKRDNKKREARESIIREVINFVRGNPEATGWDGAYAEIISHEIEEKFLNPKNL